MSTTQITQHNVTGVIVERRFYPPQPAEGFGSFYVTSITVDTEHLGRLVIDLHSATLLEIDNAAAPEFLVIGVRP